MRFALSGWFLLAGYLSAAQLALPGMYTGIVNGDPVQLELKSVGKDSLYGQLQDSRQSFVLMTKLGSGHTFAGRAYEYSLGIDIPVKGALSAKELLLTLDLSGLAGGQKVVASLAKQSVASAAGTPASGKRQRDPALTGTWTKTEMYNSGYGGNYMSATSESSLSFLSDGRLIEGGSQVVVGGSNYTGSSSSSAGKPLEGITWYTEGQVLYLQIDRDGQTQSVRLGRYYIENGNMLITGEDGTKQLFKKRS